MTDSFIEIAKAVGAFILLVMVLLVAWLVVSPVAAAIRFVMSLLGAEEALDRFIAWLKVFTPFRLWNLGWSVFPSRTTALGSELRIVIDNRLNALQRSMSDFEKSTRGAVGSLLGLGASRGPSGISQQMSDLGAKIDALGAEETPYEIDEQEFAATRDEIAARRGRWLTGIILIIIAIANGNLLALVFRDMGWTGTILGYFQISAILAVIYVVVEAASGLFLQPAVAAKKYAVAVIPAMVAIVAVAFEVIVFEDIGAGQSSTGVLDQSSPLVLRYMGLFGFVLGTINCIAGYYLHHQEDILNGLRAKRKIRKDATAWNALLIELPQRIDSIRDNVSQAQAVIDGHLGAIGGRSDAFSSAVSQVSNDRDAILTALNGADVRNWPQWIGSDEGDRLQSTLLSIGLALLTIAVGCFFAASLASEISEAIPSAPAGLIIAGAIGGAVALYASGLFLLSKVQLIEHPHQLTIPLRSAELEKFVSGAFVVIALVGVWGISILAHGWKGVVAGALNVVMAIALIALGTQWNRSLSGIFRTLDYLARIIAAVLYSVFALIVQVVGWVLVAVSKALFFVINFLSIPFDVIRRFFVNRTSGGMQSVPANAA